MYVSSIATLMSLSPKVSSAQSTFTSSCASLNSASGSSPHYEICIPISTSRKTKISLIPHFLSTRLPCVRVYLSCHSTDPSIDFTTPDPRHYPKGLWSQASNNSFKVTPIKLILSDRLQYNLSKQFILYLYCITSVWQVASTCLQLDCLCERETLQTLLLARYRASLGIE